MSKIFLRSLTLLVTVIAALFLSGCGGDSRERERQRKEAEDMVYEAYLAKNYPRIIELVDSFRPLGSFTEGKASLPASSSHDIVEVLKADTDHFRDGAEQNDDLTLLAFRFTSY